MATKPIPQQEELPLQLEKAIPSNFKVARNAMLQLSKTERDLLTDIEEAESGNYIISGLQKYVTELDLTAFTFAVGQILYNQSYQSGNEDINSGIKRKKAKTLSEQVGETMYNGNIVTSLSELCRLAYGTEPTTELKKKMATLIDTIDRKPVEIKFPNGDLKESKLCVTMDKYTREKDGAILYNLYLNPIFSSKIQNQFGELPQDIIEKLDKACKVRKQRKQAAHYLLIRWLSVQDKRYSHTLSIDTLIKELRMEEYFKKDRGKADKQLLSICEVMKDVGILSNYVVEYSSGKRNHLTKVTFQLSQNFVRLTNKGKEKEKA
jgi:hypothetical protein